MSAVRVLGHYAVEVSSGEKRQVTAGDIKAVVEKRAEPDKAARGKRATPTARLRLARELFEELEAALAGGSDPAKLLRKLRSSCKRSWLGRCIQKAAVNSHTVRRASLGSRRADTATQASRTSL